MTLPSPSLSDLGWSDRWTPLLAGADLPDGRTPVPARVVRRDRGAVLAADGVTVAPVPVAGFDPATGDWLALDPDGRRIAAVLPRHGVLRRRGPDGAEQILAANVDLVVLVCGADRPLRPGRIHRGAVQAWDAGAAVLVILTKADLAGDPAALAGPLEREAPGVDVLLVSAVTGAGLDAVRAALAGRTTAFVGESGAGKSTLLNALAGAEVAATGVVRTGDAKGRHTTTRRELHVVPGAGRIVDTPGLRSFGLAAGDESVDGAFADIADLAAACRFTDCRHAGEPGCAAAAAVASGELSPARLEQYHRLQREVASELLRATPHERRRQERRFGHAVRDALRAKGRDV